MEKTKFVDIDEKDHIVCVNISRTKNNKERENDYERARKYWRLSKERADKANLVFAIANGIVVAVFRPTQPWQLSKDEGYTDRYEFVGEEVIDSPYIGKSVYNYINNKAQNPVQYINL
jgi:hypothetical protein